MFLSVCLINIIDCVFETFIFERSLTMKNIYTDLKALRKHHGVSRRTAASYLEIPVLALWCIEYGLSSLPAFVLEEMYMCLSERIAAEKCSSER